jgi:hypothetical protein
MMTTLVIISLLLAVGGVSAACGGGVPESISSMVYALRKDRQWLWSAWLFAVTALLMPRLLELAHWAGWLTTACLVGVAVTPIIKEETRGIHNWLGIAAGVMSQVCVAWICPWWLFLWVLIVYAIAMDFADGNYDEGQEILHGKGVFVAEVVCMVTLYAAVLVH